MSGSRTTIAEGERLDNVHPGDVLREDFLVGSEIAPADVAAAAGLEPDYLARLLGGRAAVDADSDLRLARFFDMSDGFFLRLQSAYDLEAARLTHGPDYDRIVPRAARAA